MSPRFTHDQHRYRENSYVFRVEVLFAAFVSEAFCLVEYCFHLISSTWSYQKGCDDWKLSFNKGRLQRHHKCRIDSPMRNIYWCEPRFLFCWSNARPRLLTWFLSTDDGFESRCICTYTSNDYFLIDGGCSERVPPCFEWAEVPGAGSRFEDYHQQPPATDCPACGALHPLMLSSDRGKMVKMKKKKLGVCIIHHPICT